MYEGIQMFNRQQLKFAFARASIVLMPSYFVAYTTGKMVYVVPTLAAAGFLAASLSVNAESNTRRVDEDDADGPDELDLGEAADTS